MMNRQWACCCMPIGCVLGCSIQSGKVCRADGRHQWPDHRWCCWSELRRDGQGERRAEMGIVLDDAHQGYGLGSRLLLASTKRLCVAGVMERDGGIPTVTGARVAGNAMLAA